MSTAVAQSAPIALPERPVFLPYGSPGIEYRDIPSRPGKRVGSDGSTWFLCSGLGGMHPRSLAGCWLPWVQRITASRGGHKLYLMVGSRGDTIRVHRLVLEAFVGECPAGYECRHLDDDGLNNRVDNLAWGLHVENVQDKIRNGGSLCVPRGEQCLWAKLTGDHIREIRSLHAQGVANASLARRFGVDRGTIGRIVRRRTWKSIP